MATCAMIGTGMQPNAIRGRLNKRNTTSIHIHNRIARKFTKTSLSSLASIFSNYCTSEKQVNGDFYVYNESMVIALLELCKVVQFTDLAICVGLQLKKKELSMIQQIGSIQVKGWKDVFIHTYSLTDLTNWLQQCETPRPYCRLLSITPIEREESSVNLFEVIGTIDRLGINVLDLGYGWNTTRFGNYFLGCLTLNSVSTRSGWSHHPSRADQQVCETLLSGMVVPRLAISQPIQTLPIELFYRLRVCLLGG